MEIKIGERNMNKELKKKTLETLHYYLGMLRVLKRHSKKSNAELYKEHSAEYKKAKELIEQIAQIEVLD